MLCDIQCLGTFLSVVTVGITYLIVSFFSSTSHLEMLLLLQFVHLYIKLQLFVQCTVSEQTSLVVQLRKNYKNRPPCIHTL